MIQRLLICAGLVLASCESKKAAGDHCNMIMSTVCNDAHSVLYCENDRYIEVPCRGSGGCREEHDMVSCDISENLDGDRCLRPSQLPGSRIRIGGDENTGACTADHSAIVFCHDGKYERFACEAPSRCKELGTAVSCTEP